MGYSAMARKWHKVQIPIWTLHLTPKSTEVTVSSGNGHISFLVSHFYNYAHNQSI